MTEREGGVRKGEVSNGCFYERAFLKIDFECITDSGPDSGPDLTQKIIQN